MASGVRERLNLVSLDRLLHCSAARRRQSLWNCCSPARILCTPLRRRSKRVMTELAVVRDRFISSMLPARARRNVEWTTP